MIEIFFKRTGENFARIHDSICPTKSVCRGKLVEFFLSPLKYVHRVIYVALLIVGRKIGIYCALNSVIVNTGGFVVLMKII